MPAVYPFKAIHYPAGDVSRKVAPPYDVLDLAGRDALAAADDANIVSIDLPHVPAKELGPPAAYSGAAAKLETLLASGQLLRRETPAMFAYRQSFEAEGKTYRRSGMACTLDNIDFGPRDGGGVLPHEQTFSGPKEDRMALMKATACQTSPIFGLHADEQGSATRVVQTVCESRPADLTADLGDGVVHEVWAIDDETTINAYRDALAGEDVFIADGHHRYTTQLNYLKSLAQGGKDIPPDHPARRTMFVLVGMSDPGLYIGPTHRVLGGMSGYSIEAFQEAAAGLLDIEPCDNDPMNFDHEIERVASKTGRNTVGLMDFATGLCFCASPSVDDPLSDDFADRDESWRRLDVAIVQHLIVDQVCKAQLNEGSDVKWAFPHSIPEVIEIGRGKETGAGGGSGFAQLAVVVRPTPLEAVRDVSKAGELMPQKSTFFYPKLATGLFLNPLSDG
ncbi:MAG: DUF1015 domain-containing protein [Planctomycetota bacterium]